MREFPPDRRRVFAPGLEISSERVKEHDSLRFGRVCPYCGREHENRCHNVPVKLVREVHDRWPKDLLIASRRNRSDQPIMPEES